MKFKKLISISTLVLMSLTSCNEIKPSSSQTPGSTTPNSSFTPTQPTAPDFSDYDLDVMDDYTYEGQLGEVTITNKKLTITKDGQSKDLIPTSIDEEIQGDGDITRTVISFSKAFNDDDYKAYLSFDEKMVLILEKGDESYSFMPSIKSMNGAFFSPYYEAEVSKYDLIYYISGDYSVDRDVFLVRQSTAAGSTLNSFYTKSYLKDVDGTVELIADYYDYTDNYLYESMMLVNNGSYIDLVNILSNNEVVFRSCPAFMNYNVFDGSKTIDLSYDFDNKTVSFDGDTYQIEGIVDEKEGSEYRITSGSKSYLVKPSAYGITFIDSSDKETFMPYEDYSSYLYGSFSYKDFNFSFNLDEETNTNKLKINNVETSFSFDVYKNFKAIKVEYDGKTYHFVPYKDDMASNYVIKGYVGEKELFLVNKSLYSNYFVNDFTYKSKTEKETLVVDKDLKITYQSKTVDSSILYVPSSDSTYLEFTMDSNTYQFKLFDTGIKAFELIKEDESKIFIPTSSFESLLGEYTTKYQIDLTIAADKLTYKGNEVDYEMKPYFIKDSFAYVIGLYFTIDNEEHLIEVGSNNAMVGGVFKNNVFTPNETFVPYNMFLDLVGTYEFNGAYGTEKIRITSDGKMYADSLNDTNNGLVEKEYDYSLSITTYQEKKAVRVAMKYSNLTEVYFIKDGASLVSFNNRYAVDYIYNYNGVYANGDNSTVIYLTADQLYVNGSLTSYSSYESKDGVTTITTSSSTFKFKEVDGIKKVEYNDETLNSVDFDVTKFVKDYTTTSGTTYSFKAVVDPITKITSYVLSDGTTNYNYIITSYNNKIALKFSILSTTIYLYEDGGEYKIASESSIPLPPPPLPPYKG